MIVIILSFPKANDVNEIMIRHLLTHEVCHRTRRRLRQSISMASQWDYSYPYCQIKRSCDFVHPQLPLTCINRKRENVSKSKLRGSYES
eukprot:scaffold69126_cov23-Cyclotella_meneghiniana.AAC.1